MLENLKDQVFSCVECKICDSVCSFYLSTEDEEVYIHVLVAELVNQSAL